jgi:hypothetical protein
MNRFPDPRGMYLFFGALLLIATLIYTIIQPREPRPYEGFDAKEPSQEDLEAANSHYAALLLFIQKYPARSIPFIEDVKNKFYETSCTVKPSIDFSSIASFPKGMIFV